MSHMDFSRHLGERLTLTGRARDALAGAVVLEEGNELVRQSMSRDWRLGGTKMA